MASSISSKHAPQLTKSYSAAPAEPRLICYPLLPDFCREPKPHPEGLD
jgi:hypothetical protein